MIRLILIFMFVILNSSCSSISGPDGYFPSTRYDFLYEEIEKDILLPKELSVINEENHYPVDLVINNIEKPDTPKPRQIFSSSQNSSVQLRRLGELMWIYVETLPSSSWPISKSYWDNSQYDVIDADPDIGEININYDEFSFLNMRIEHGIKEASTEIFLNQVNKTNNELVSNPNLIQTELSNIVNYFAEPSSIFSGTSLAAQNLNERKKTKIYVENGQTVIELDLNFARAWSSVSKAMTAANIISNDRDRSNGIFYVSYEQQQDKSFFSFMGFKTNQKKSSFSEDADFEVKIIEKDNKTYVRAYSKNGKIEESEELLSKINELLS